VLLSASPREALLDSGPTLCVCPAYGTPVPTAAMQQAVPFVMPAWVAACIADGVRHTPSSFPHFTPGPGPLPLTAMASCSVRITALGTSGDSHKKRRRFEELVTVLGAKVAQQSSRWAEITHIVCAMPELLDRKMFEAAGRKGIPVVGVQWLFDCFRLNAHQPESRYAVAASAVGTAAAAAAVHGTQGVVAATAASQVGGSELLAQTGTALAGNVLSGYEIFISPSALGSDERLPRMAEELGAKVRMWRNAAEMSSMLEAAGVATQAFNATGATPSTANSTGSLRNGAGGSPSGRRRAIVLLDKEEACNEDVLVAVTGKLPEGAQGIFVIPAWLSETFQQRRRLPLDAFRAFPEEASEANGGGPAKKPRLGLNELGEAAYAWQPAALRSLEALAEASRADALASKAQEKMNAGLRLAELSRSES